MKKVLVYNMIIFFAGMTMICLFSPDQLVSVTERRTLEQFPELTLKTIASGKFMEGFEEYAVDQFPFREAWRSLKARIVLDAFGQSDNNELYVEDGHISKIEYPLNEDSIRHATQVFQRIYTEQLANKNCKVYYSVIPDKNYFLGEKHLHMNYEELDSIMREELDEMTYIDITGVLEINDYYKTDSHWRQEKIVDVAEKLAEQMGSKVSSQYEICKIEKPFYGVYHGQSALNIKPDELCYLTNDILESCTVFDYQNEKEITIYDMEKVEGDDPYEMFLSGSISLLTIQNPKADTERELVIFRDSFGSSIAPLLAEGYSKVTLVDVRYINSSYVETVIDFENADVLFLYSTSVLNHSETLK